jgi:purine-binding chemotaxis protein CheW
MNTASALTVPSSARPTTALGQLHFHEVLTCQLGGVSYGISLRSVQEIRSYEAPTRLANAPACVKGVIDLRGIIVPIVDLRLSFGLDSAEYDSLTVTVVLNVGDRVIGVVVDSVSDVIGLSAAQIQPPPQFSTAAAAANFIAGIGMPDATDPQRMLVLLDIEKLMSSAAIGLFDQAIH